MEGLGHGQGPKRLVRLGLALCLALLGLGCLGGLVGWSSQGGRWVHRSVTRLGETHDVNVYLPEGYPAAAPYPVVYLLHGWAEHPEKWRRADVGSQADLYGVVLVAVEGDDDDIKPSWYSRRTHLPYPAGSDWRVSFYDWFFEGVLPWIEANYEVCADPGRRAIAGFSMGGKGALSLAGHRPDLFAAVAAIAGVVDLRDYADRYEIPDVYGPLAGSELRYAADSPVELAANLKGLSITLLHGAEDTYWAHYEQSRMMSQRLNTLGYPHVWEEIPGQDHDPVSTYEITRTFECLAAAFEAPYSTPMAWRYRFADDTTRQVYDTTLTKTDPLTWTEIMSVTPTGFEMASGDAFSLTTASWYTPLANYVVTITNLLEDHSVNSHVIADSDGRLSLSLPAGRHRAAIAVQTLATSSPTATYAVTAAPTATRTPTTVPTPTHTPSVTPTATRTPTTTRTSSPTANLPSGHTNGWVQASVTYQGETHDVNVYLPANYPANAPYSVVYLLHGWDMDPEMWRRTDVENQADLYGTAIVAVEGDDNDIEPSWYSRRTDLPYPAGSDWSVSFYDWFFEGVLPWLEANYSVRTDPGGRAIAGFSMGGKGALSLAGHRPDLFAAAGEFGGVMELRDYSTSFEISDVYGPQGSNEISYAADSPVELAPNLKGLLLALLHGAEDHYVHYQQSREMDQALNGLGYPHLWEEVAGLDHGVNTYQITRTFEYFSTVFDEPYDPPVPWRYRFADDTTRQVYDTTLTKTDPLTWTEVMSVTATGFDTASGDAFTLTTAPWYTPMTNYVVTITDLVDGGTLVSQVTADGKGRLTLTLPAGRHRTAIEMHSNLGADLAPRLSQRER